MVFLKFPFMGRVRAAVAGGLLTVGWGAGLPVAFAQSLPNAGSLLKDLRDNQRLPEENTAPAVIAPMVRPTIHLPEGATVKVARFKITGNTLFDTQVLAPLVQAWEGQTLDLAGLNEASSALTRYYQSHGYILSYAYLPAQKVERDVVEIAVLEGRMGAVQVVAAQDVRLGDAVIQQHLGGSGTAQPARQDVLERQLLLLNDIPGIVARGAFTPGTEAGSSDMVVSVVEDVPLANSLYFNNYGSTSTGDQRVGAQFQLRDVFGVGDATQLALSWASGGGLVSGNVDSTVLLGADGWTLRAGAAHLTYALQESFSDLGARGVADTLHTGLQYPIQRSSVGNITLRMDAQYSNLRDLLTVIGTDNRKNSRSVSLGLNLDGQDHGGRTRGGLTYQSGLLQLESGTDPLASAGTFEKSNFELTREQWIGSDLLLYARTAAQLASKNLDSSEKMALGGPFAVRAYAAGELSVDEGTLLTVEVRYLMPLQGGMLTWTLFNDLGQGSINHQPLPGVTDNDTLLNGAGIGLGWRAGSDWELALTAAWRGRRLPSVDGDRVPRVFLQLTKSL